tara:strand:- start:496 stop:621 length:126 start_codon:yes stop_codon:yes gene_type:complete
MPDAAKRRPEGRIKGAVIAALASEAFLINDLLFIINKIDIH